MAGAPLRLGPLGAPGFAVMRSGVRWLCENHHACRPGEVIAYCNIALVPIDRPPGASEPFVDEARDFQVAFAPRFGGRLSKSDHSSLGGFLDQLPHYQLWAPDFVIGHLDCPTNEHQPTQDAEGELRLLLLAGHRMTELAEVRSGLLTGWHDRSRAWWDDGNGALGTLLSLGICEQNGIIRGEQFAFLELFEAVRGPAHVVFTTDDALVPCARITVEQLRRTRLEFETIARELARSFPSGPITASGNEWIFAGALLSALKRSPLSEQYDVLTRTTLRRKISANAVILSLNAEAPVILRHQRLGYAVSFHRFRLDQAGPAVRAWLRANFEPVERTASDIYKDYIELIDTVRARGEMTFLVLNCMSSSAYEDINNYASFDRPMGNSLSSIRGKEMNLMLHDIARERDISIVDVDAIAADLGAAAHLPDGVHGSGLMQAEVRGEILRILHGRGVAGFSPARSNNFEFDEPGR